MENVAVINIGLRSFALEYKAPANRLCITNGRQSPAAIKTGSFIRTFAIRGSHVYISAQANAAVIEQIRRARPHWLDCNRLLHLSAN